MYLPNVLDDFEDESNSEDEDYDSNDSGANLRNSEGRDPEFPRLIELSKQDISQGNLQYKITKLKNPVFYVSFPNPHYKETEPGPTDHFGILKLWDEYM